MIFKSYSKISIDFDKDSVAAYQDFIGKKNRFYQKNRKPNAEKTKATKKNKDSLAEDDLTKMAQNNQFFLGKRFRSTNILKNLEKNQYYRQ